MRRPRGQFWLSAVEMPATGAVVEMTLAEALARAEGVLDGMYAVGIANYKKLMRHHGASERQIEEAAQ